MCWYSTLYAVSNIICGQLTENFPLTDNRHCLVRPPLTVTLSVTWSALHGMVLFHNSATEGFYFNCSNCNLRVHPSASSTGMLPPRILPLDRFVYPLRPGPVTPSSSSSISLKSSRSLDTTCRRRR